MLAYTDFPNKLMKAIYEITPSQEIRIKKQQSRLVR